MPDEPLPLQMQLSIPSLGERVLNFRSMRACEELSRAFDYQVVAVSEAGGLAVDELLGKPAAVSVDVLGDGGKRWFHGIVTAAGLEGVAGRFFTYRLQLQPWLWLLTRRADIRVFQDLTTPQIVKQIFDDHQGVYDDRLTGSYPARPYCVQYRETDFNFVSRLMEEEGIFYFFRHAEGEHRLVLADSDHVHLETPGFESIRYLEDRGDQLEASAITQWRSTREIEPGKLSLRDFDFESPATDLTVETNLVRAHAEASHEVYDYPGLYDTKAKGQPRAEVRLREWATRHARVGGEGNTPGLVVGARFALEGHPGASHDGDYVVLATEIEMLQAGHESDAGAGVDTRFACRFEAQPAAETFRPARLSRKPTVAGLQTAIVVGDRGDGAIETDAYGRVKVQFHWDRIGSKNLQSSCWVRVASPVAGNGFGFIAVPRVGHEVVVAFLEGDPDRPIIVGSVYNAIDLVPYALPAHATVSTFKSRSRQAGADAFNELRFEDAPGAEYLLLQAQKDRLEIVEDTLQSKIGNAEHRQVGSERRERIGSDWHLGVGADVRHAYGGKLSVATKGAMMLETEAGYSLKAAADFAIEAGATISMQAAGDGHLKLGGHLGVASGGNVHLKGAVNIVVEAGVQLTLKAGPSFVVIGPDGVSITGPLVKVNSGGAPGAGAGANPVAPTPPDEPLDPVPPKDPLAHR